MRYLGGKGRLGNQIAVTILSSTSRRDYYLEPFVGGANAFIHLAPHFAHPCAGDIHEDLILMWQAVARGWVPPSTVTEDDYNRLRHAEPSALRAFCGFPISFGGKWFGGYARSQKGSNDGHNYAESAARTVLAVKPALSRAIIRHASFDQWSPGEGWCVYCDPPYANTTEYASSAKSFDSAHFWYVMDYWVERGAHVFVSEYTAPAHWRTVGSAEHVCNIMGGLNQAKTECLFTRSPETKVVTVVDMMRFSRSGVCL